MLRRFYGLALPAITVCIFAVIATGCGATDGGTLTPRFVSSISTTVGAMRTDAPGELALLATAGVGQTTATSLKSIKYLIRDVQLCQDMTFQGTGYSNTKDCISIYENPDAESKDLNFYNSYTVAEALNDTSGRWIDFMSATDRAKLSTPFQLTSDHVGVYKYGMINFARPVKITAEFIDPTTGLAKYFTKKPSAADIKPVASMGGGMENERVEFSTTNTMAGPAEELTLMLNNGGTWFAFHKPFEITDDDIKNKTELFVDFVFNPEQFATASASAGCSTGNTDAAAYDSHADRCVFFNVPMGKFAPVPRKTGETTAKEIYLVSDYSDFGAEGKTDMRIELYYNSADSAKSIQGIDGAVIAKAGATRATFGVYSNLSKEVDGVVTFYGYNPATTALDVQTLTGLKRRENGTVTVSCMNEGQLNGCTGGVTQVSRAYTYIGTVNVN